MKPSRRSQFLARGAKAIRRLKTRAAQRLLADVIEIGRRLSWKYVAAGLVLFGLILTAVGAAIAASGVILTLEQATELASTKWNMNLELRDALLDQSRKAMRGLIFIAIGTVVQLAGTIIPLIRGD